LSMSFPNGACHGRTEKKDSNHNLGDWD